MARRRRRVAGAVAGGEADQGLLFCWTGTGTAMAANKVPGVRAALAWEPWIAEGARRWNDANVLVMSLKRTSPETAREIVAAWLAVEAPDEDERENIAKLSSSGPHASPNARCSPACGPLLDALAAGRSAAEGRLLVPTRSGSSSRAGVFDRGGDRRRRLHGDVAAERRRGDRGPPLLLVCTPSVTRAPIETPPPIEDFHRLTRDIYVPAVDMGFWQGVFRDPSAPEFAQAAAAIQEHRAMTIDVLYGDHEGGQRTITRFGVMPRSEGTWITAAGRYWNVDREDPR